MEGASPGFIIAVLSDTHGRLYPRVRQMLAGADHIIHAGDIDAKAVLDELRSIAPVTAVRGNCDLDVWSASLAPEHSLVLAGVRVHVSHMRPRSADHLASIQQTCDLVVFGHSHMASIEEKDGVVFLNPGAAGPRRFGRPRTVARVTVAPPAGTSVRARLKAEIMTAED